MKARSVRRREVLGALAALGGLGLGGRVFAAPPSEAGPRLVTILLRGAVDGLNVVTPYTDARYYQARSSIALAPPGKEQGLLDLDGHFGLHPACAPLLPLWQSRRLAVIHAAGSPDPSRSHFDAQDFMETARPGEREASDGWLNRALRAMQSRQPQVQALSSGPTLSRISRGDERITAAMLGADGGRRATVDQPPVAEALAQLYQQAGELSGAYREARQTRERILDDLQPADAMARASLAQRRGFALEAAQLATLLRRQAELRLVFTSINGWDTHVRQGGAQGELAGLLDGFSQGLARLATDLDSLLDDTLILVMSEFGRTLRENGSGGTDHGHGNIMLLLGAGVAGGKVYGQWPGLDDAALFEQRDLAVTTDFRSVLAYVGERHLRLSDKQLADVFPKAPPAPAGLGGLLKA
ncbi:Uncharacterized conserved protein, DUF1501 family [Solimonas aquatica]|uniref:Uncharacterized conserved protein, DUF1501 family n=1 Tax=Solimonas aquatica TaxID=489703 RepID=A0A1H8ZXM8_9GAMM|nr:DUF1501 domain-containing protein [Solimonas aquatica]SEP69189.1 Uncharacterized conserved protein, DUF1501 family [Solimonas aquatica]